MFPTITYELFVNSTLVFLSGILFIYILVHTVYMYKDGVASDYRDARQSDSLSLFGIVFAILIWTAIEQRAEHTFAFYVYFSVPILVMVPFVFRQLSHPYTHDVWSRYLFFTLIGTVIGYVSLDLANAFSISFPFDAPLKLTIKLVGIIAFSAYVVLYTRSMRTKHYQKNQPIQKSAPLHQYAVLLLLMCVVFVSLTAYAIATIRATSIEEYTSRMLWNAERKEVATYLDEPSTYMRTAIGALTEAANSLAPAFTLDPYAEETETQRLVDDFLVEHPTVVSLGYTPLESESFTGTLWVWRDGTLVHRPITSDTQAAIQSFLTGATLEQGEITLSQTYPSYAVNKNTPIILMRTPVYDADTRIGVLTTTLEPEHIFTGIADKITFVVDPEGYYLWHPDKERMGERINGKPSSFFTDYPEAYSDILGGGGITDAYEGDTHILLGTMYPGIELDVDGERYRVNGAKIPLQHHRWIIGIIKNI